MNRSAFVILTSALCILLTMHARVNYVHAAIVNEEPVVPAITITKLDMVGGGLEVRWEIRNGSGQDAWILAGLGDFEISTSVFMAEDDRTLLIRRRLDMPANPRVASFPVCNGRYTRLRPGETQCESVFLCLPVHCEPGIGVGGREPRGLEYATRLAVEIGYYSGDLPDIVRQALEEDEKDPRLIPAADPYYTNSITGWFGGVVGFNELNERVRSRDDEVLLPYTDQAFTGEQVLQITVSDQNIPYEEKIDLSTKKDLPDLSSCTRVEIQYHPSMLEYFFPYAGQQSLLSPWEKEHLKSAKIIVVEDHDNLRSLADEVAKGVPFSDIVRQRSVAEIICCRDNERLTSIPIYNDDSIVTERHRFQYEGGLRSLRALAPNVQPLELRVKCSANLKNLWHRFRLYEKATKPGFFRRRVKGYPTSSTWCDSMLRVYRDATGTSDKYIIKAHICPSAGSGKCHYAMNPNCRPDSPVDMVLLFETKAGWNQHGGPELFTFDNHDPKGGCILLNDGTVKFIRTQEELQQLRWK